MGSFIARPTQLLLKLIKLDDGDSFLAGRMAVGLEIISLIKLLEDHGMMSVGETRAVANVLRTFLIDQELGDAWEMYDRLDELRKPVFVPEPSPSANADAASVGPVQLSLVPSSDPEGHSGEPPRIGRIRALLQARRSQGDVSIVELWGLNDEEPEATPSG